jgi:pyruvate/2-oxoglutarate dehydrogenase complex dihydrolipoamide dehydrogenase (E3) component
VTAPIFLQSECLSSRIARLPMDSVLGAQATDQREGFMKALVADGDDRILGFAVHTAMLAGLSYPSLVNAALAHPTMAEGLSSLFSNVPPRAERHAMSKVA